MAHYLDRILNPTSIAIIGASRDPAKRGYRAIQSLFGDNYTGKIYPINPKESEILGVACFPTVTDVPGEIDVALVCTAAKTVPGVIESCGRKGVKGAIVLAGGFGEASEAGRVLEEESIAIAKRYNLRLIGPNTNGMFSARLGCNAIGLANIPRGSLALLSNSANVNVSALTAAQSHGYMGISTMLSVGNQSDIFFHEYVESLGEDPDTKAIISYVEGFKNGPAYLQVARRVTRSKPIVMYVAGRNAEGKRAAKSHSGSLAGDYQVSKDVLAQAGVTVVTRADELYPVAEALTLLPPMKGRRVAVLSEGGGVITVAAEALVDLGMSLAPLSAQTQAKIHAIVPNASAISNPVDSGGGTDPRVEYCGSISRAILEDPSIDALLIVGFFGGYTLRYGSSVAEAENAVCMQLAEMMKAFQKPIVVQSHYLDFKPASMDILRRAGVPVQRHIEIAAKCLSAAAELHASRMRLASEDATAAPAPNATSKEIIRRCRDEGRSPLETEALELLKANRIEVPPNVLLRAAEDAKRAVEILGERPLAMKVVAADILHKSDVGGVTLNVAGAAAVAREFWQITKEVLSNVPDAKIIGILATPMAKRGVEVIIGLLDDAQYGRVVMLGIGGVFVEVIRDVAFRALPLSTADATDMIEQLRFKAVLEGARGSDVVDKNLLSELLLAVSRLGLAYPEISELDLNPVIARSDGFTIVDARMVLKPH